MKKIMTVVLVLGSAALLAKPHIKENTKEYERDGINVVETSRDVIFDNGRVIYMTKTEKGQKKVLEQKWGDSFFGLEFGRPLYSNGGWSIWNFFEVYYWKNKKYNNVIREFTAENISLAVLGDQVIADFTFLVDEEGKDGKVHLRMIQFKSHPAWIFFKVKFDSEKYHPWRINLSANPGNADNPKERERWAATKENQYNLSTGNTELKPASAGLLLFSKFVHEDFGNMVVFNPEIYEKINIPKAGAGVTMQFFPKKGLKEFEFAVSYFSKETVSGVMPKFLGEDLDHIYDFLKRIKWEPDLKSDNFAKSADEFTETLKKLKTLGTDTSAMESEFETIKKNHAESIEKNDMPGTVNAMESLNKLKQKAAADALNAFN